MSSLLDKIENKDNILLYVLDETAIRLECKNYYSWSLMGKPTIIEKNSVKKGINIIGATEIAKQFTSSYQAYPNCKNINSQAVIKFLRHLLRKNRGKSIIIILDNAKFHKSKIIEQFAHTHKEKLYLIYLPAYSPNLNPQENIWK